MWRRIKGGSDVHPSNQIGPFGLWAGGLKTGKILRFNTIRPLRMPHLRVHPPVAGIPMAERVRNLRHQLRLGRPQLAVRLGVSRQYITKLEAGAMPSKPVLLLMEHLEKAALSPATSPGTTGGRLPSPPLLRVLPLLTLSQARTLISPTTPKPAAVKHLAFVTEDAHAFALKLEASADLPPDLENCLAIASPGAKIRSGDFVIVCLKGDVVGAAMLRVFHSLAADQSATFAALRPEIPPMQVTRERIRWMVPVVATLRYPPG